MARRLNSRAPESSMEFDVAHAQANSNPGSYSNRYTVSADGMVIPKANSMGNMVAPRIELLKNQDGSVEAYIPQLALGTSGGSAYPLMNMAAPPESNAFGDSEYFGMWDTVLDQRDGKWNFRRAIRWWNRDPLVYRCIKMLAQFSNTDVSFKSQDENAQRLVDTWFKQAQPYSFRCAFYLEYFRTGYVPILKTLIKYEPRNYKENKIPKTGPGGNVDHNDFISTRASIESGVTDALEDDEELKAEIESREKAEAADRANLNAMEKATDELLKRNQALEDDYNKAVAELKRAEKDFKRHKITAKRMGFFQEEVAAKQYRWQKGQIPGSYMILDPLLVDLKGPQSMEWLREPYLQISGDMIAAIMNPTPVQKMMIAKLPQEIVGQIKDGGGHVWLSPNIFSLVTHDKTHYERYPVPMMRHAFDSLQMKYDIIAMDQATVRGIKNRILLVKVGNDTYPVTDPGTLQHVASIFNSIGRTGTFFWSHNIEMEWVEPELTSFATTEKYLHWNAEIRTCFGITPILTGGGESTGGAIGNQMISFKGVQMEVTGAQNSYKEFLEKEIRLLKTALGISADIEIDIDQLNMKDENQFWTVVTQAVMNGIIDHQTALELLGFHFPQIADRMKEMKPLKKQGLFAPQPSANNMGPAGEMKPQGGGGAGGRQKNTKPAGKNSSKKNKSQPKKAKASMRAVGDEVFVLIEASEEFDNEQRIDIAKLYGVEERFVKTTAEFRDAYPAIDVTPDWPELSSLEAVSTSIAAYKLIFDAEKQYEKACADYKKDHAGESARGAYLTPQKKNELKVVAKIDTEFNYLKQVASAETLPSGWEKHFNSVRKGLADTIEGAAPEQLDAQAWAMTVLRYKKSRP